MKSPAELGTRLARQWQQAGIRAERLLNTHAWPLRLAIGKPSAGQFANDTATVHGHVQAWKTVDIGKVLWEPAQYRAGMAPVQVPTHWILQGPSDWVAATSDAQVRDEFKRLEHVVEHVDETFRELLVRKRALWLDKSDDDVINAAHLAMTLTPNCARGRPLRLLSELGVDTKFFERHGGLLTRLLDERFDGAASEQGLAGFLDALEENDHWLLVAPLDDELLPFQRQRVPASELLHTPLPAAHILVVENEQCFHLLPRLPHTIAILGAGHNLLWMRAAWLDDKVVGYWGDMDSWGVVMLARAREHQPGLTPLMMNQELFDCRAPGNAVPESTTAQEEPPDNLTEPEKQFYRYLISRRRGRLEQEYLPENEVHRILKRWIDTSRR